jgi:hypothetical protein
MVHLRLSSVANQVAEHHFYVVVSAKNDLVLPEVYDSV